MDHLEDWYNSNFGESDAWPDFKNLSEEEKTTFSKTLSYSMHAFREEVNRVAVEVCRVYFGWAGRLWDKLKKEYGPRT